MGNCPAEQMWLQDVVDAHPKIVNGARILEIGSAIESHSGRFPGSAEHVGLDVAEGGGVDVVSIAHEYKTDLPFDIVCSFSALEHDMYWKKTLKHMAKLTRSGGLVIISCCRNWEEHGTLRTSPEQSYTTKISAKWANYYRNVSPEDILSNIGIENFTVFSVGTNTYDDGITAFWGIKR